MSTLAIPSKHGEPRVTAIGATSCSLGAQEEEMDSSRPSLRPWPCPELTLQLELQIASHSHVFPAAGPAFSMGRHRAVASGKGEVLF